MEQRMVRLPSGNAMPTLGLGTWRLSGSEGLRAMRAALDMGYRHMDTADMYGNHEVVGEAIRGRDREELFITSKVPADRLHRDQVIATCDQALVEMRTDYLDLFLIHWPDPHLPMTETFDALAELVRLGKARDIGVSNFQSERLGDALTISSVPIANNQVELHPLLYQRELIEQCHDAGVTVTAYCPLGRGKALDDPTVRAIAQRYDRTPAQVSLRWLLHKGCVVIPRSRNEERLRENMEVYGWELAPEDEALIDAIEHRERLIDPDFAEFQEA